MKNKAIITALLLISTMHWVKKISCNEKSLINIDALQFRAPYSLAELLHDGLVAVEHNIQETIQNPDSFVANLEATSVILDNLQNQYFLMVDKSNMHTMQRDDRDFLQNMIDRIDSMIEILEKTRSGMGEKHRLIEQNQNLLSELKLQLAS